MAVFLMVTSHLECKIRLLFKPSSVILKETFKIKSRKKGRRPGCFRKILRCCCIYGGIPGIPRDSLFLHPSPLSSACPGSQGRDPRQCRHRAPVPGTAAGGVSWLCSCREREPTQHILSSSSRACFVTQGRIGVNLNNSRCQPYLSSGTPHKLPPPSTRE